MTILAVLLLSLLLISSGHAQIVPEGFYNDNRFNNCTDASQCRVGFAPVPADKVLIIGHVSCHINTGKVPIVAFMIGGTGITDTYLKPLEIGATSTNRFIQSSDQLTMIVPSGKVPTIKLNFSGKASAAVVCTVTGQFKP
jgi:hypothetical protein